MLEHIIAVMYRMLYQEFDMIVPQVSLQLMPSQCALEIHVVDEAVKVDHPSHAEEREMSGVAHREYRLRRCMFACPYGGVVYGRMPVSVAWKVIPSLTAHYPGDAQ